LMFAAVLVEASGTTALRPPRALSLAGRIIFDAFGVLSR